jgi:hypothetical protein
VRSQGSACDKSRQRVRRAIIILPKLSTSHVAAWGKEQLEQEGFDPVLATVSTFFCKAQHRPRRSMRNSVYGESISADVKERLEQEGGDQVLVTAPVFFAKLYGCLSAVI